MFDTKTARLILALIRWHRVTRGGVPDSDYDGAIEATFEAALAGDAGAVKCAEAHNRWLGSEYGYHRECAADPPDEWTRRVVGA
jgi:hypothetical protein